MRSEFINPPLEYKGYLVTGRLWFDRADHFIRYDLVLNERVNLDRLPLDVLESRYGFTEEDMRQFASWVEGVIVARNL